MQLAAAVAVLIGVAMAVWRGTRDRGSASQTPPLLPGEQRYYFDGPMGEALRLLRDGRNVLNEIKEHVAPLGELGRNTNKELGEIKDKIDDLPSRRPRR